MIIRKRSFLLRVRKRYLKLQKVQKVLLLLLLVYKEKRAKRFNVLRALGKRFKSSFSIIASAIRNEGMV
jgi:hypothetical protein